MSIACLTAAFLLAGWPAGTSAEAGRLVPQLGSPAYAERQTASKALREMGEAALDALRQGKASTDPEVRRLRQ